MKKETRQRKNGKLTDLLSVSYFLSVLFL